MQRPALRLLPPGHISLWSLLGSTRFRGEARTGFGNPPEVISQPAFLFIVNAILGCEFEQLSAITIMDSGVLGVGQYRCDDERIQRQAEGNANGRVSLMNSVLSALSVAELRSPPWSIALTFHSQSNATTNTGCGKGARLTVKSPSTISGNLRTDFVE